MRIFVKYGKDGEVLSVARVQVMPGHLDHPFGDDPVLELASDSAHSKLDDTELHERYRVDLKKKQLVKKKF